VHHNAWLQKICVDIIANNEYFVKLLYARHVFWTICYFIC
jgi:hypothetical protein